MFNLTRSYGFDDIFNFHRTAERFLNQIWNDVPIATSVPAAPMHISTDEERWRLDVALPGIDPKNVKLEVTGGTLSIRAEQSGEHAGPKVRYAQSVVLPEFFDRDKVSASYNHGMLTVTLPLKDSVKPRRIDIEGVSEGQRQLTSA